MKYYKITVTPLNEKDLNQVVVNDESVFEYVMVESDAELQEKIDNCIFNFPLGYVEKKAAIVEEIAVWDYIEWYRKRCTGKIVVDYIDKFYTGSLRGDEIKFELEAKALTYFLEHQNIFELMEVK
ncbi:hypothetical protein EI71_00726 [Anaeroplasma bactoclasticum]|jgi:hypothetical protein|uniref:Uncharacterized protein n=1 Tax=Anaeroplasma bactoclasticum TaxID=2088 RepID=A0A397RUS6_9MOLU|nr:hypothetical protein [Anaeroplasma bactoclasticum]RIA77943.1 hypothetical protein EI71_00726 [Anaeroplasma bactoclasticum]